MALEPIKLVLVTLLPGQVIMGACAFCQAPLPFEIGDSVVRVERCRAVKCAKAREVVSRETQPSWGMTIVDEGRQG